VVTSNDQSIIPIAPLKLEIGSMAEVWAFSRQFLTYRAKRAERRFPGDSAKRQECACSWHQSSNF
jgi:hypothetical protein